MRASLASPPSLSRVHTSLALLTKKTLLDMLKTALKRTPDLAETAHLRRLFHEAYAVTLAGWRLRACEPR